VTSELFGFLLKFLSGSHRRRKGGQRGPCPTLDFEIISKKGCFFAISRGKKQISPLLAPWKKFWENPLLPPPLGKNPSDAYAGSPY